MNDQIEIFCNAGLYLVPIPPQDGKPTKAPVLMGWNRPRSRENLNGYSNRFDDFKNCDGFNFGLYHGASNTLALDLDDVELAKHIFDELTDLAPSDWLESGHRAEVKSPKANRGKLLFKLPDSFNSPGLKQLKHNGNVIFELRCGNCQDVIFGEHPEGGRYEFIGDPVAIPEAPEVLLNILAHWDDWKPCFDSALGIEQVKPKIAPRKTQSGENLGGWRDPITEFNQANRVGDVLLSNGYQQRGKDRFIRPGSESKAPGAAIMHSCADSVPRVYSHGGDKLNDGYAHDAFDCYRLLECGGDFAKALNWSAEITRHNQRLYAIEQGGTLDKNEEKPVKNYNDFFERVSIRDVFTDPPEPQNYVWGTHIPVGELTLLAAHGGTGKSFFALQLGICVALGQDFLGRETS